MTRLAYLGVASFLLLSTSTASAQFMPPSALFAEREPKGKDETNFHTLGRKLKGRIVDHTANHGHDNRIWSKAMHQWRDLYIYVPPSYDPNARYPLLVFLHPFAMDERVFLKFAPFVDDAIASGKLPPCIIAVPDGSLDGKGCLEKPGSFFLNSHAGPYEDFLLQDMWDFVCSRYPIRPERNAHVLAGVSMGGFSAFNLGMRHRNAFGIIMGIHPPLNTRWADVDGNPRAKFDPRRWGWRTGYDNAHEVIASYGGAFKIYMGKTISPVFGVGDEALVNIAANNPLELMINTRLRNGELSMFVGYGGHDEYNIDAQVESFLYYAKHKGIGIAVAFEPDGRHDGITAIRLLPAAFRWLAPQLEPYAPALPPPPEKTRPTWLP